MNEHFLDFTLPPCCVKNDSRIIPDLEMSVSGLHLNVDLSFILWCAPYAFMHWRLYMVL